MSLRFASIVHLTSVITCSVTDKSESNPPGWKYHASGELSVIDLSPDGEDGGSIAGHMLQICHEDRGL